MSETVGSTLLLEIERVAALRERYASIRGMKGVNVEPAIFMMSVALAAAREAIADSDVTRCIVALSDLGSFTD